VGRDIRVFYRDDCGAAEQPDRRAEKRAVDDNLRLDGSAIVATTAAAVRPDWAA
jgi:hypothetical protein